MAKQKQLTAKQLFKLKSAFLKSLYDEVKPLVFYRDLFPEGSLEEPNDPDGRKPNMIVASCFRKPDDELAEIEAKEAEAWRAYDEARARGESIRRPKRLRRSVVQNRIVFDDFAELEALLSNDNERLEFVIIPPVAFSGRNRTRDNAYHLWGIAIDLDGVEMDQLQDLVYQIQNEAVPEPTYLVNSGHGLHVYYLFEDPVPLYPYLYEQLHALKRALTDCVWNAYTSTIPAEKREYQSIVQGYRAVGSASKLGKNYRVTAFRVGTKRTIQYLMEWAEETGRVDFDEFNHVTLDQAREKWPEWFQSRIVEGKPRRPFKFKHKGVYEAWLRRMERGAFDGNRYYCICVLFSLAYKTEGISFEEALEDAMGLVPRLNRLTRKEKNEFTSDDVLSASSYFDAAFQTLGLKGVYHMTKIHVEPNKRNHRSQEVHLGRARALQNHEDPEGEWRNKEGRPTKDQLVAAYRAEHPEASVTEVAKALRISRPTVYKWWDAELRPAKTPDYWRYVPGGVEPVYPDNNEPENAGQRHALLRKNKY